MTKHRLQLLVGEDAVCPAPAYYCSEQATTLAIPLRPGYRFCGWLGEELTRPTPVLTIPRGSSGERTYRAVWEEIREQEIPLSVMAGRDQGLLPRPDGALSQPIGKGKRGEDIYLVKTVYTDIVIDGVKDAAYDYGVHLAGEIPSNEPLHRENPAHLELWFIRGQDGRAYAYGEVTDADLVASEEMLAYKPHHCDAVHLYVETGNHGMSAFPLGLIIGSEDAVYASRRPAGSAVRRTSYGFSFEVVFDNRGFPFYDGDEVGFAMYYNNTNKYRSTTDYQRLIVKLPSGKNPAGTPYRLPFAADNDGLRFSSASATGLVDDKETFAAPTGDYLRDLLGGALPSVFLHNRNAAAHTVMCGWDLRWYVNSLGGRASVCGDAIAPQDTESMHVYLGVGSAPESLSHESELAFNAYAVRFSERGICALGWKEKGMRLASGLLRSAMAYVAAGGSVSDLAPVYEGSLAEVPVRGIPRMEGLTVSADAGGSAYLLQADDRPAEAFDAYARLLEENGFALFATNRMSTVRAATYINDETVVNLTYGDVDRTLRAVVDSRRETVLPPSAPASEAAPVCESRILQLAPVRVGLMCYALRLNNGEYLMIDAGGNGASRYLHDAMLRHNGGAPVVVAAWIFTHFHCDHIGGLLDLMEKEELRKDFTIRTIVHNFPQKQVLDTASPVDQQNLLRWPEVVRLSGAKLCCARTGQKYRFANAEIEMLFTYEDLAPFHIFADRTNPTSHIFSLTVEGQRFIITGDACREASSLVVARYGDALKADFVQLPHHGLGDGGTDPAFYDHIAARWVLLPAAAMHLSPAERREVERTERCFFNADVDTVIPLPYDGGELV